MTPRLCPLTGLPYARTITFVDPDNGADRDNGVPAHLTHQVLLDETDITDLLAYGDPWSVVGSTMDATVAVLRFRPGADVHPGKVDDDGRLVEPFLIAGIPCLTPRDEEWEITVPRGAVTARLFVASVAVRRAPAPVPAAG